MKEKVTSIRVDEDLWKKAKILAIKEGFSLEALIEELLRSAVEGAKLVEKIGRISSADKNILEMLRARRVKGKNPFEIIHEKTAVELVREGRGD